MSLLINHFYRFGKFTLDTDQRVLLRNGKPIPLTRKAFETLLILVTNNGRIVEKEELMTRLWPDTFVEEANLSFNIQQLRKSLGDDARHPRYIETVARRGYRFIADVEEVLSDNAPASAHVSRRIEANEPRSANGGDEIESGSDSVRGRETERAIAVGLVKPDTAPVATVATRPDAGESKTSPPVKALTEGRHSWRRYLVLACAGLILLSGIALVWWPRGAGDGPAQRATFRRLTSTGKVKAAAISPDGKYLAYVEEDDTQQSLSLKQVATGSTVQILPPTDVPIGYPAFSPDGDYLYYVSRNTLYRLPVLGGSPQKVFHPIGGSESHRSFSPDGKQFAFLRYTSEGEETASLHIVNVDGTGERVLASTKRPKIFLRSPAWSPDGKVIACSAMNVAGYQEVVAVRVAGGPVFSIPSPELTNILQITWRPDGGALLLVALEKEGFFNQICQLSYPNGKVLNITNDNHSYNSMTLAADGRALVAVRAEQEAHIWAWPGDDTGEAKQLTKGFEKYDGINVMEWLRDGKIVYEANPSGKTELLSIGADGRNAKPLAADLNYLTMSPDGNYIIIQDSDADGLGLFRVSLVGGEKKRLTTGTDVSATFSPDGQWVVFTRYADQVALWKVPIGGGEAIKLTDILGYPVAPAVSPDGRLIAFHWGTSGDRKLPAFALVPFEGGEVTKTFEASVGRSQGFGRGMTVRWSPDGQSFNYVAHREGVSNIWRQPIDGSQPVQVTDFRDGLIFNFAYSPDGKQLALSRGTFSRDVVLIALPPMIEK